ncbi:MAG: hypothetical protein LBQ51_04440 [Desulfovibrio sp.]|jgi:hypothetical protein|nr:hypothetical protein [Desulfovibrio sp.]
MLKEMTDYEKDKLEQEEYRYRYKLPNHVRYWDDERATGNGIIVTLH